MEFFSHLALGLETAFVPANLLYCLVGVLVGTLVGVLPGVGTTATVAMLLPMTFTLSPASALIMLAGIYYGAQYGGSTTAILVNMPGEASSAVTALDGHKMAVNGRAGPALTVAALGSFFAGTVATLIVAALAVPLSSMALRFGPEDYFALIVVGLICSITLAHGNILSALAMVVLGLLLGIVGTDLATGARRFTFGLYELTEGLSVAAIAIGLFGIPEMLRKLETESRSQMNTLKVTGLRPSRAEARRAVGPVLRGSALGSLLGVLPGGGAVLSAFASYALEKRLSSEPHKFGTGMVEGVAGPESANNAGAQTSFIPTLALGLPSNPVMALLIGAMIIHGIVPGPTFIADEPTLFWGLIASMWIGNLLLVILNLPLIGLWVKLLSIPYYALFPAIIMFASIGAFAESAKTFDVLVLTAAGLVGYVLSKLDCEPAPLLLGFVLGPMLEENFRRTLVLSHGDFTAFVSSPIALVLLVVAVVMIVLVSMPRLARRREEVFSEES